MFTNQRIGRLKIAALSRGLTSGTSVSIVTINIGSLSVDTKEFGWEERGQRTLLTRILRVKLNALGVKLRSAISKVVQ